MPDDIAIADAIAANPVAAGPVTGELPPSATVSEAPPGEPSAGAETPKAEAKPDAAKPDERMGRKFAELARQEAALRKEKDAIKAEREQLTVPLAVRDAIQKHDSVALVKALETGGWDFDKFIEGYASHLAGDGKPEDPASKALSEVTRLKAELDEQRKANERIAQEANVAKAVGVVVDLAKSDQARWELVAREGSAVCGKVYEEVTAAWLELGQPTWSKADFDTAVAVALDAKEKELDALGQKYTKKPKTVATTAQETPQVNQKPKTISAALTTGAPKSPPTKKLMTRHELIEWAVAEHAARQSA